jgi:hypothetical protein
MQYVIFDYIRAYDIERMDTTANTPDEAQRLAEAMAKEHQCKVFVLAVVGVVECPASEPSWTKPLPSTEHAL